MGQAFDPRENQPQVRLEPVAQAAQQAGFAAIGIAAVAAAARYGKTGETRQPAQRDLPPLLRKDNMFS